MFFANAVSGKSRTHILEHERPAPVSSHVYIRSHVPRHANALWLSSRTFANAMISVRALVHVSFGFYVCLSVQWVWMSARPSLKCGLDVIRRCHWTIYFQDSVLVIDFIPLRQYDMSEKAKEKKRKSEKIYSWIPLVCVDSQKLEPLMWLICNGHACLFQNPNRLVHPSSC